MAVGITPNPAECFKELTAPLVVGFLGGTADAEKAKAALKKAMMDQFPSHKFTSDGGTLSEIDKNANFLALFISFAQE